MTKVVKTNTTTKVFNKFMKSGNHCLKTSSKGPSDIHEKSKNSNTPSTQKIVKSFTNTLHNCNGVKRMKTDIKPKNLMTLLKVCVNKKCLRNAS